MMHLWGDEWPYWPELYQAGKYMAKLFERARGKPMYWKEKWGTIRYEYEYLWLKSEADFQTWKKIIRKAVRKYPNVAAEICSDAGVATADEHFRGWCAGVCYLASPSYEGWSNNKGIIGFPDYNPAMENKDTVDDD